MSDIHSANVIIKDIMLTEYGRSRTPFMLIALRTIRL